jgi:hypothetical protein
MTDTHALTRRIDIPAAGGYTLDPVRSSLTGADQRAEAAGPRFG